MTWFFRFFTFLLTYLALINTSGAQEYGPKGLYDVKSYKLMNGMEVYLRERHEAKNTSIRLVVNVGHENFPCGKNETAHFLEHLLFTGTSKHTENDLDAIMDDNGGAWNALTSLEQTIYEIDIYSKSTILALETLHEIITDSTITTENVELTRDIIHRELGGEPTRLVQLLYQFDIGKSGYEKSNEIIFTDNEYCDQLDTAEGITREEIIDAYKRYYVPNNMALFVVGDFDSNKVLDYLYSSFGKLKPRNVNYTRPNNNHSYMVDEIITGTLSPMLSDDAEVSIRYRVKWGSSDELLILGFISNYLSRELYKKLRVENGMSYSASSSYSAYEHYGVISLDADAKISDTDKVTDEMLNIVNELIVNPIELGEFNKIKRGLLLAFTGALQSNDALVDYYSGLWNVYLRMDGFDHLEDMIESLTPEDVHRVAGKCLLSDNAVIVHETPALTYNQLFILIAMMILFIVLLVRHYVRKRVS